jgi:RNAse (barnase) inhibitor barstar
MNATPNHSATVLAKMTIDIVPKTRYFFLDGSKIADKESFFKAIALAMDFPDYFGHNWDAFAECINDLSWIEEERKILIWVDPPTVINNFQINHRKDYLMAFELISSVNFNLLRVIRINE